MNTLGYSAFMEKAGAYLELKIDLKGEYPEVRDLGDMLGAVADQYDDYVKSQHDDVRAEGRFYIKKIQEGSMIFQFIANAIGVIDSGLIMHQFYMLLNARFLFQSKGGNDKLPASTVPQLEKMAEMVSMVALAESPKANMRVAYRKRDTDGGEEAFIIEKSAARDFMSATLSEKLDVLEDSKSKTQVPHRKVLLRYFQTNIKTDLTGKKNTGEKAIIEAIDSKPKAVYYESDIAEHSMKHEMLEEDDNIYKKGFIVDVVAESSGGKLVLFRITDVHDVIDIPDDQDESPNLLQ